jgi:phosphoglycerate dehydrogenase-like enzyme
MGELKMEVLFTFNLKDHQMDELIAKYPDVQFHFDKKNDADELSTSDVVVTYGSDVTISFLNRATKLKWLMVASAGVDKMPLAEIAARNIVVTNVRGIHKTPMAESVLAHILSLRRALPQMYEQKKHKDWNPKLGASELRGSTAIILGPGAIGSEIGRLLQAFGVYTIGCNRSGKQSDSMNETIPFNELLPKLPVADYCISVLPSTPGTKKLLTAEHFNAMKETAVFMNFGRGDLVDEKVIVDALSNKEIATAVLDVFEIEPLPAESELWILDNCIISPHVSSHSNKYVERALVIFNENLEKWLREDTNLVNPVNLIEGY